MDIKKISKIYTFKKITSKEYNKIYMLYKGNTLFYEKSCEIPTLGTVKQDSLACPFGKDLSDKFYLGIYKATDLIGVIDFIVNYPEEKNIFIGLFMLDIKLQNKGIGSRIIQEFLNTVKKAGFIKVRLAYIKGYNESENFWLKNNFFKVGLEIQKEKYKIVLMERIL